MHEQDTAPDIVVEEPSVAEPYTQIPNRVLRDPGVPPGAKLAYALLLSYAWHKNACFPGQETLARDMGVSVRSVVTYMKQLEDSGLVEVRRRGQGKTNLYVLRRFAARSAESARGHTRSAKSARQDVQALQDRSRRIRTQKNTQEQDAIKRDEEGRRARIFEQERAALAKQARALKQIGRPRPGHIPPDVWETA